MIHSYIIIIGGLFQFVNLACNLTFSVCFYEFVNKNMLPPRIIYCSCVCVSPFPNQSQRERNSFLRQDSLNAAQHFLDSFSRYWDYYFYSASDWMCTKPQRSVSRCFIAWISLTWKKTFLFGLFFCCYRTRPVGALDNQFPTFLDTLKFTVFKRKMLICCIQYVKI